MLPDNPLVSIIVPSFNQGAFIRQTIESCLAQDYRPIEIIVVDGASTDNTVEVLQSFGDIPELKWVSEPDSGVADAVNKGCAKACGEIAAIQSSDDAYLPVALTEAVVAFHAHPEAALIYGDCVKVDADGRELSRWVTAPFSVENFLSKATVVLQPAAFFRLEAFCAVGGWSENYFIADTECWLRMVMRYPAVKIDAFWGVRRMHGAQREHNGRTIVNSYNEMIAGNPDLKKATKSLRRAARCGALLHTVRYGEESEFQRQLLRWRAALVWPPILREMPLALLLGPGFAHRLRRLRNWHG